MKFDTRAALAATLMTLAPIAFCGATVLLMEYGHIWAFLVLWLAPILGFCWWGLYRTWISTR